MNKGMTRSVMTMKFLDIKPNRSPRRRLEEYIINTNTVEIGYKN
jgi:hypothetical protein